MVVILFFFKSPKQELPHHDSIHDLIMSFDPVGTALFLPAIIALLLALQWGGTKYSWGSGPVVGLLLVFGFLILDHFQSINMDWMLVRLLRRCDLLSHDVLRPPLVPSRTGYFGCWLRCPQLAYAHHDHPNVDLRWRNGHQGWLLHTFYDRCNGPHVNWGGHDLNLGSPHQQHSLDRLPDSF